MNIGCGQYERRRGRLGTGCRGRGNPGLREKETSLRGLGWIGRVRKSDKIAWGVVVRCPGAKKRGYVGVHSILGDFSYCWLKCQK